MNPLSRALSALLLCSFCALPAQVLDRHLLHVDGATATAVGVLWAHGYHDDDPRECGLARVLAACRLARAERVGPLLASGMLVGGDFAIVFGVVGGGDVERAERFVAALRDDDAEVSDDELALIVARAALAADDSEFVYPGGVIETRARRRLAQGTPASRPPDGVATAISRLTPAVVRERLRAPTAVRVGVLGFVSDEMRRAVSAAEWPDAGAPARPLLVLDPPRTVREATRDVLPRADSPYAAVAFVAPPAAERAAFALALEVANARALARYRPRGRELFARAPFVAWSWLRADAIARFHRRGEDPQRLLPGERPAADADAELEVTTDELEALLADLRDRAPSADELGRARTQLRLQLALPGPGVREAWASEPAMLPGRLQALLLGAHHGVAVEELDTCTPDGVHACIREHLAPGRASWHTLLPPPADGLGYRRR